MQSFRPLLLVAFMLSCSAVRAADYPAPKEADWTLKDFKFHTGETLPELRIHYTTLGEPTGQPVLMLHGTTGSGRGMLTPAFAGELFGAGQPLDATKYFIILPDAIGHGKTTKPSDDMKAKFPKYNSMTWLRRSIVSSRRGSASSIFAGDGKFNGRNA